MKGREDKRQKRGESGRTHFGQEGFPSPRLATLLVSSRSMRKEEGWGAIPGGRQYWHKQYLSFLWKCFTNHHDKAFKRYFYKVEMGKKTCRPAFFNMILFISFLRLFFLRLTINSISLVKPLWHFIVRPQMIANTTINYFSVCVWWYICSIYIISWSKKKKRLLLLH